MKEEVQRSLKCKESSVSCISLLDRSDTTADNNNNNNDSDKRSYRIIHEGEERYGKGAQCLQNSLSQQPVCFQSRPIHELQPQT